VTSGWNCFRAELRPICLKRGDALQQQQQHHWHQTAMGRYALWRALSCPVDQCVRHRWPSVALWAAAHSGHSAAFPTRGSIGAGIPQTRTGAQIRPVAFACSHRRSAVCVCQPDKSAVTTSFPGPLCLVGRWRPLELEQKAVNCLRRALGWPQSSPSGLAIEC